MTTKTMLQNTVQKDSLTSAAPNSTFTASSSYDTLASDTLANTTLANGASASDTLASATSTNALDSVNNTAPTATPGNADRRTLRSRKMMREAIAVLISERGLGNFTVGDLMDKADLNRSTFYGHYSDLDALLSTLKQEIIDDLEAIKPQILAVSIKEIVAFERTGQPPSVTVELFDTLREHGKLLQVLLSPHGDAQFQAQLRDVVCTDLIRSVLHKKYTQEPSPLVEYYIAYYASALLGLIQRWLDNGMTENSEAIGRLMLSIMFLKPGDPIRLKGKH